MSWKYEKLYKILRDDGEFSADLMEKFNETDKSIVDEIIAHNKKCDIDISYNNYKFWREILDKSYYADDVLYSIIISPYAPKEIVEEAIQNVQNPHILTKALEINIPLSDKTYDIIQKRAKRNICDILSTKYRNDRKEPLPFSQYAINYYAKKAFEKTNVKNDKMLIMLAYTNDTDFLKDIQKNPHLNQIRLNHLMNNENINDDTRNKMFNEWGFNHDDLMPDFNAINTPTNYMIKEIYLSNIEAYFCCDKRKAKDKKIQNLTLERIISMLKKGWLSPSIEKDIIQRYEKGDKDYRWLLRTLLTETKNMDTIDFASCLNAKIFSEISYNKNLSQEMHKKYGLQFINKNIKKIEKNGCINGYWNMDALIKKVPLKPEYYDILLNINNEIVCGYLASSPLTPENVLEKLTKHNTTEDDRFLRFNTALTAKINLLMRKEGFSNSDIAIWGNKFLHKFLSYYNLDTAIKYDDIDEDFLNAIENKTLTKILAIATKAAKTHTNPLEVEGLNNFFKLATAYEDAYEKNKSDDIYVMSYSKLNKIRDTMYQELDECKTLGELYTKIDEYADKLIVIQEELVRRDKIEEEKAHDFSDEPFKF